MAEKGVHPFSAIALNCCQAPGNVEIPRTSTNQSSNAAEKSLHVNSTQLATIEIEGLGNRKLRSAQLLLFALASLVVIPAGSCFSSYHHPQIPHSRDLVNKIFGINILQPRPPVSSTFQRFGSIWKGEGCSRQRRLNHS